MSNEFQYGTRCRRWIVGAVAMLALVAALFVGLQLSSRPAATKNAQAELVVYCAAGIRKPVEELARIYTEKYGVPVRVEYGSSGELEFRTALEQQQNKPRADLYIPADAFFAERAADKRLTRESIPLAEFRLVLAKKPSLSQSPKKLEELLISELNYVLCDQNAGVGKKLADTLGDRYEQVAASKKASYPRVTEAASSIQSSAAVDVGFIWNTTAKQFGLDIVDLPELAGATSRISANVVATSERATEALRFARFLSAPETGNPVFEKFYFDPIAGDQWAKRPEITLFCGGVNRTAVKQTIEEFERREGCDVLTTYQGCGALVATMKGIDSNRAGHFPDAFLTCEASYLDKVAEDFGHPSNVSSTEVIMMVRRGNPKNIQTLDDLADPSIAIGTADPKLSALGKLSWKMFADVGIEDDLAPGSVATTPSAHELILQMTGHNKLDVVLVYRANCMNIGEEFEQIPISHPLAKAIQNVAIAKRTAYPQMTGRLLEAIRSAESKQRFLKNGFEWLDSTPY